MKKRLFLSLCLLIPLSALSADRNQEAQEFLTIFESFLQPVYAQDAEAAWKASTDVSDTNIGMRMGAGKVSATVYGNKYVIDKAQSLLNDRKDLKPIIVLQLEEILRGAAGYPGTIPEVVNRRVELEAKQSAIVDGFEFCLERKGDTCSKKITPNEIDDALGSERDLKKRLKVWKASKEIGVPLKKGLPELRDVRNRVAKEFGYSSYHDLQVSDYGMTVGEMNALLEQILGEIQPLHRQVHCWAKQKLAKRYGKPVPKRIPAHWLSNRWGQSWPGIVEGVNLDRLVANRTAKWVVAQAERFYVSLGYSKLPKTFWTKSDLFALPKDAKRKKNTHASAWHMDLANDVRSLMSVKPDWRWFGTTHHELGHIYYYMAYSNPEVPLVLRGGANRAFHEAVGDLIFLASTQADYLREIGLLKRKEKIDRLKWLLNESLEETIIFLPFGLGVMSKFEHDLYEKNLPARKFNRRWWELAGKYQGIEPPEKRSGKLCDPCTKTHINDDPAQYYDYALAQLIRFQLHNHICTKILGQDVHHCSYYKNKKVGKFIDSILRVGKTRNWRELLLEATGEPISSRALLNYYKPVADFLAKENQGVDCSF